jgi:hypothetical protein
MRLRGCGLSSWQRSDDDYKPSSFHGSHQADIAISSFLSVLFKFFVRKYTESARNSRRIFRNWNCPKYRGKLRMPKILSLPWNVDSRFREYAILPAEWEGWIWQLLRPLRASMGMGGGEGGGVGGGRLAVSEIRQKWWQRVEQVSNCLHTKQYYTFLKTTWSKKNTKVSQW